MQMATTLYEDTPADTTQFIIDTSAIITGVSHNNRIPYWLKRFLWQYNRSHNLSRFRLGPAAFEYGDTRMSRYKCQSNNICDLGFKQEYRDGTGDQPHHFWFYVAVSYLDGGAFSLAGSLQHEFDGWKAEKLGWTTGNEGSWEDLSLGEQGRILGTQLRNSVTKLGDLDFIICRPLAPIDKAIHGSVSVSQVPDWIWNHLADPSYFLRREGIAAAAGAVSGMWQPSDD